MNLVRWFPKCGWMTSSGCEKCFWGFAGTNAKWKFFVLIVLQILRVKTSGLFRLRINSETIRASSNQWIGEFITFTNYTSQHFGWGGGPFL